MDTLSFLQNLGLSMLLGGLVGLERERSYSEKHDHNFGGIRTMALTSMLSYTLFSLFSSEPMLFALFTAGFLALLVSAYLASTRTKQGMGATTELATIFVYILGILVGLGELLEATILMLFVVTLLHFKQSIHQFVHRIERHELYDTLKFIAIVFVVLPLLPNETFGPLDVLNPYLIWLMVVLISSISFVSYIAIKLLGSKNGIGLGGFLGGLVSSTAVAMSFSQMSKKSNFAANAFSFGILIASTAMFFRVLITVSVLNVELLPRLLFPLGLMGLTGLGISFFFWFYKGKSVKSVTANDLNLSSPFQLWPALQFALLFAALLFLSKLMNIYFGDVGVYFTAVISGLVDVDAITISMAKLSSEGSLSGLLATRAITVATLSNTLMKAGFVVFFASQGVAKRIGFSVLAILTVGLVSIFFLPELHLAS